MDCYDIELTGKVKSLVEEFEKADARNHYDYDIGYKIRKLKMNKWDIYLAKFPTRIGFFAVKGNDVENINYEDIDFIEKLISERLKSMPEPTLSENEKIDRIIECFEDGWFEVDLKMLREVAAKVKAQDVPTPG